jgi:t-SNARE complex subunit (syntaxin)
MRRHMSPKANPRSSGRAGGSTRTRAARHGTAQAPRAPSYQASSLLFPANSSTAKRLCRLRPPLHPLQPLHPNRTAGSMSFNDSSALESQPPTWRRQDDPQYADDPEFQQFTTELSDKLFSLTANISKLSSQAALLGTRRETDRVRERVQDLLTETGDGFKEVGEGLKQVQAWHDLGPSQKYTQGKLAQEFRASLTEFQGLQRLALEKQRASATAAKAALEQDASAASATTDQGRQTQQQLQEQQPRLANQDDVDFRESLIMERESEIRNIEQSVGELNELFRDVAHMVHEQGQSLDRIDENVVRTRDDTQSADQQLRTAARHQKSARGKACCLLIILVLVLTIIILAAVLG